MTPPAPQVTPPASPKPEATPHASPQRDTPPSDAHTPENRPDESNDDAHSEKSKSEVYDLRPRESKTEKYKDFSDPDTKQDEDQDANATSPKAAGKLNVTQHALRKHRKKRRSFRCEACTEVFTLAKDLNKHYTDHHPQHEFKCSQCDKKYASRNAQKRHERGHDGMPFSCDQCKYTCMFSYELKHHVKRHTGRGLYPCPYRGCQKSFTTKKGMLQHGQVHDGEEYTCDVCGKPGFTTKGYLRQHKKRHAGGFVSRCGGFASKSPTSRQIHQRSCDQCKLLKKEKKKKLKKYDAASSSSSSSTSSDSEENNEETTASTSTSSSSSGRSRSSSESVAPGASNSDDSDD